MHTCETFPFAKSARFIHESLFTEHAPRIETARREIPRWRFEIQIFPTLPIIRRRLRENPRGGKPRSGAFPDFRQRISTHPTPVPHITITTCTRTCVIREKDVIKPGKMDVAKPAILTRLIRSGWVLQFVGSFSLHLLFTPLDCFECLVWSGNMRTRSVSKDIWLLRIYGCWG